MDIPKQDRTRVRTAHDIEQKYDLNGKFAKENDSNSKLALQISQLSQSFAQFMTTTNLRLEAIEAKVAVVLSQKADAVKYFDYSFDFLNPNIRVDTYGNQYKCLVYFARQYNGEWKLCNGDIPHPLFRVLSDGNLEILSKPVPSKVELYLRDLENESNGKYMSLDTFMQDTGCSAAAVIEQDTDIDGLRTLAYIVSIDFSAMAADTPEAVTENLNLLKECVTRIRLAWEDMQQPVYYDKEEFV